MIYEKKTTKANKRYSYVQNICQFVKKLSIQILTLKDIEIDKN